MGKNGGRTIGLFFKVSPEEMGMIQKKMEFAGTLNKRAYLRKMAVDGYIVRLDMESVKELVRLMASISNNVNQIARRLNETGNLYEEDVKDLQKGYGEVRAGIAELVKKFAGL